MLKGEIGDILTVVFKNNASRPYSVHADGVLESSSGLPLAAVPGEQEHLIKGYIMRSTIALATRIGLFLREYEE